MPKMALLDCSINEKLVKVLMEDRAPLFSFPSRGIWQQLKSLCSREFAIQGKKNTFQGSARGGGLGAAGIDWCIWKWIAFDRFIKVRIYQGLQLKIKNKN